MAKRESLQKMMKNKFSLIFLFIFMALGFVLSDTCYADKGVFQPKVTPDEIVASIIPQTITVTSEIGDIPQNDIAVSIYRTTESGELINLLCQMYNDGTHGDLRKDSFYSGQFILSENRRLDFYFKIIAEYNSKEKFFSPVLKVSIYPLLPFGITEGTQAVLKKLKNNFHKYLKTYDLATARKMTLEDAKRDKNITEVFLNGRDLGIVYKNIIHGIASLDDPNADPVDAIK